jgi:methenyltetrahydrofolate cyclohydrolase
MNIYDYCGDLGSISPVPGGGSAAGIVLSIAASCIEKSIRFSFDESKFTDNVFLKKVIAIKAEGFKFSELDQIAFKNWSDARKLPKETEEEKSIRSVKISELIIECINVPRDISRISFELLQLINEFIPQCNKYLISDVAVGTSFAFSAFESGIFNIKTNLPFLKNENMKKDYDDFIKSNSGEASNLKDGILKICEERILSMKK